MMSPIDQSPKHYSVRRVLGWRVYYRDTRFSSRQGTWADVPAIGIQFVVVFFEEQYRIWIPEQNIEALHNYRRILPSDPANADYYWMLRDGSTGDDFGHGNSAEVPGGLAPWRIKIGTLVPDIEEFRRIRADVDRDFVWE